MHEERDCLRIKKENKKNLLAHLQSFLPYHEEQIEVLCSHNNSINKTLKNFFGEY